MVHTVSRGPLVNPRTKKHTHVLCVLKKEKKEIFNFTLILPEILQVPFAGNLEGRAKLNLFSSLPTLVCVYHVKKKLSFSMGQTKKIKLGKLVTKLV